MNIKYTSSESDARRTFGKRRGCRTLPEHLEIAHPHAAGIDIGGQEHYVAVPADRAEQAVRCARSQIQFGNEG